MHATQMTTLRSSVQLFCKLFLQVDKSYLNYRPYFLWAGETKVLKGLLRFGEVSWKTTKRIPTFLGFISPPGASGDWQRAGQEPAATHFAEAEHGNYRICFLYHIIQVAKK